VLPTLDMRASLSVEFLFLRRFLVGNGNANLGARRGSSEA
jgi:hypothetical protein